MNWLSRKSKKKVELKKKAQKGSRKSKANNKQSKETLVPKRGSRRSSSHTTSKTKSMSNPVTPERDSSDLTDERKRRRAHKSRLKDFKEQEPCSENDDDLSTSRRIKVTSRSGRQTRHVEISNREIDEETMEKVFVKFTKERKKHPMQAHPMDAKTKILMDRVVKKPYPLKYKSDLFLQDETSSFYKPSKAKKPERSEFFSDNPYKESPKLSEILKLPEQNVFAIEGIPFWAVNPEPNEEDLVDVEPSVSVGSEQLEQFHDRKLNLMTIKATKLKLNELQPLNELSKRDEVHFHPHLVFSNTIRSLINVQQIGSLSKSIRQRELTGKKPRFEQSSSPGTFVYSRTNPVESIRALRCRKVSNTSNITSITPTTSSSECLESVDL